MGKMPIMTFDRNANALYVRLRDTKIKRTTDTLEQLGRTDIEIHLDLDEKNAVVGIEILL